MISPNKNTQKKQKQKQNKTKDSKVRLDVMVHAFDPSTQEIGRGISVSLRSAWLVYIERLCRKTKQGVGRERSKSRSMCKGGEWPGKRLAVQARRPEFETWKSYREARTEGEQM